MTNTKYNEIIEAFNNLRLKHGYAQPTVTGLHGGHLIHESITKGDKSIQIIHDVRERNVISVIKHDISYTTPKNMLDTLRLEAIEPVPKYWFVNVRIHVDGYEKIAHHCVKADNQADAEYQALCDETHNEPLSREDFDNDIHWEDEYMVYRIDSIREVDSDFHATFHTY